LTHPVPPLQDFAPSFSPDGHRLAYASFNDPSGCDLEVLDLDAALNAQGPARRLMKNSIESIGGCAWTRDGKSVIFGTAGPGNTSQLWRVGVDGTGSPERIEIAG